MSAARRCWIAWLSVALSLAVGMAGAAARPLGGDFTLRSADGDVSLAALRGKVVPIYFGYTSCPDVCPSTLSVLGAAMRALEPAELERVAALFVSLDPQRDDLVRLAEYARFFHPRITGVTATPEILREVAGRYRVTFARRAGSTEAGYTLDHTSRLVLVGPDGSMRRLIPDGTPPEAVTEAIRSLLSQ